MSDPLKIGVRYCGGCNPRYDRVSFVKQLERTFPEILFLPAQRGESYTAVLLVCGCLSQCVSREFLSVPQERIVCVGCLQDLATAIELLKKIATDIQMLSHALKKGRVAK